jgi:hypothetical protein
MFDFDTNLVLKFIGTGFAIAWVFVRLGYWKGWYWRTRGGVYAYLPLGIVFILYTYQNLAQEQLGSNYYLYFGGMILLALVCVWWSVKPPAIVQPTWIRWVEEHPRRVRTAMAAEVQAGEEWEEHVQSKESVDAWARRLRQKMPKSS